MSFEFTPEDRALLTKYRFNRFRKLFVEPLSLCYVALEENQTLTIHCLEAWVIDQLLNDIHHLRWYAWTVLGATHLSICYSKEEVYSTPTRLRLPSGVQRN